MKRVVEYFGDNIKKLFLVDSIGAFMTAFFLFVVMRPLHAYFGMPQDELTYLSILAVCYCFYSAGCYFFITGSGKVFIRLIGVANLLYCVLTFGLVIHYFSFLSILGLLYFIIEISVIGVLGYVEIKVGN